MTKVTRLQRLSQKEEKSNIKRIILFSILSVGLIIIMVTIGLPSLGKLADFTGAFKGTSTANVDKSTPHPPIIDNLPEATNQATLNIGGISTTGSKVEVFVDRDKVGEAQFQDTKFKYELTLKNGDNNISAKAVSDLGIESDFSQTKKVVLDTQAPKINLNSPTDGQSFSGPDSQRIKVTGQTDKDSQVFVNGYLASVSLDGSFSVFIPLHEGDNNIEIKAADQAGNTTVQTIKVHYSK